MGSRRAIAQGVMVPDIHVHFLRLGGPTRLPNHLSYACL
jgi:hypothetical protein